MPEFIFKDLYLFSFKGFIQYNDDKEYYKIIFTNV